MDEPAKALISALRRERDLARQEAYALRDRLGILTALHQGCAKFRARVDDLAGEVVELKAQISELTRELEARNDELFAFERGQHG